MMVDMSPKYSGEPTAQALASGLATLGRYGDNYMVHAAEGETVVPREVLESNPGLKEDLFKQMTMMGIENPNRYVVGNELNSINPITGQPEFFFKKVFRAIKRVVKKVAPIAAPIIGNIIAPGIGGIIASGITTKLQGGSIGDALKSMALSYGAQALTTGIGSALKGTMPGELLGLGKPGTGTTALGRFGTGLQEGLTTPFTAASNLFSSGAQNPLAQGIFGPRGTGTFFSQSVDPAGRFAQGDVGLFPSYKSGEALAKSGIDPVTGRYDYLKDPSASGFDPLRAGDTPNLRRVSGTEGQQGIRYSTGRVELIPQSQAAQLRSVGALDNQGLLTPKGEEFMAQYKARLAAGVGSGGTPQAGGVTSGTVDGQRYIMGPSGTPVIAGKAAAPPAKFLGYDFPGSETLAKVAGQAALPLGLAGAAYFLTEDVQEEGQKVASLSSNDPKRIAYEKWQSIEDKNSPEALAEFETWYGKPAYTSTQLASSFGANPLQGITSAAANVPTGAIGPGLGLGIAAAGGGEITGPGTGTSDSIPAMLSDGEFVMTAKAVRNAGNGDRDLGAARMYDMMNRFERGTA